MKTSKKLISIIAAFLSAAVIAVSGCGVNNSDPSDESIAATAATTENTEAYETTSSAAETTTEATEAKKEETAAETAETESGNAEGTGVIDAASLIPADLEVKPALWKATDPESGSSIYLLGTFHAVPDGTYPLPDYIEEVYANSDGIAVEYDVDKLTDPEQLDMAAAQEYNAALVYTDGTFLRDHVSEETYAAIKDLVDNSLGGWNEIYDYYNIGFWISTIASYQVGGISGFDFAQGIDRYFTAKAKADNKSVTDIEPLSAQLGAINAYTDALGDYVIKDTLDDLGNSGVFAQTVADIYTAWAKGDVDAVEELNTVTSSDDEVPAELAPDIEQYMDMTYYSRNIGMAEKAAEFIRNGDNVFFMVGLFHFAGDNGIPALLTNMGFTVEKVY